MSEETTKVEWDDYKDEIYTYFGKCQCGYDGVMRGAKYCSECGKLISNPPSQV